MPYEQPAVISCVGGIDLHGREGMTLEWGFTPDVDISGINLVFEVDTPTRIEIPLVAGASIYRKNFTITQTNVEAIWFAGSPYGASFKFVVRAPDLTPPQVYWEGLITIHGYVE